MAYVCRWCGQTLRFDAARGWVHPQGGAYMMKCRRCGWKGALWPSPTRCPACGSASLEDDHCVMPVPEHTMVKEVA